MKRFHLSNIIFTLVIIICGLILLLFSTNEYSYSGLNISSALSMIGSFLVVGAMISFYFENFAKFQLFEEVFERVIGSSSAFRAGVNTHFQNSKQIDYEKCIRESKNITTFFTYSKGFLKRYREDIECFIDQGNNLKMYFVSESSAYIKLLIEKGWCQKSIAANYSYLKEFEQKHEHNPRVRLIFCDAIPSYSAVFFDHELYIIEQTSSKGARPVPAMKIDEAGYLAEFYRDDLKRLEDAV